MEDKFKNLMAILRPDKYDISETALADFFARSPDKQMTKSELMDAFKENQTLYHAVVESSKRRFVERQAAASKAGLSEHLESPPEIPAMAAGAVGKGELSNRQSTKDDLLHHLSIEASTSSGLVAQILNEFSALLESLPSMPEKVILAFKGLLTRNNLAHALYPVMGEEPEVSADHTNIVRELISTLEGPDRGALAIQLIEAMCLKDHKKIETIKKEMQK